MSAHFLCTYIQCELIIIVEMLLFVHYIMFLHSSVQTKLCTHLATESL